MSYDYDVIIIGCGPAGFSCAMQSSKFDKKALVIESNEDFLGGTWINTGTVPSKALREGARMIQRFNKQFGSDNNQKPYERFKMADLLAHKMDTLKSKNEKVLHDLQKNEIDVERGHGRIVDEHTVEITYSGGDKKSFTSEFILVSTGSRPVKPTTFEVDHKKILDYVSILNLTHIPHRLVILGGGVNAIEYATTFSALGTRVSILNEQDSFLPFLDHEIRDQLIEILDTTTIEVHNSVSSLEIRENSLRNTTEVKYEITQGDRAHVVETEHILYLGGKIPNSEDVGLQNLELSTTPEGFVDVDGNYRTEVESVYAAGDVIGFPALASASFSEGRLAACNMFGISALDVEQDIPFGVYSIPEMSNIGLTEKDAVEMGLDVTVGRAYYKNITQADISNQEHGLLKLVFSTDTLKLLGVHIIGERASDLIHVGQAVMSMYGDIRYFIKHVLKYATYSEACRIAAFNGINRVYKAGVKYKKILKNKG